MATQHADIVLTTLNARYMHSAFGLRYLMANLNELESSASLIEFTIQEQALNIAEKLLAYQPKIIGFSVYIWNVREITDIVTLIKQISPEIKIILGGPEVGHYPDVPTVCDLADYVISGPGEKSFRELSQQLLSNNRPEQKYIDGEGTPLDQLTMPYHLYDNDDIRNRLIYVEASRGCPFKCEFCLSALDKSATAFPLENFLTEMDALWQRGVRNFKFIDRTFNLKVSTSVRILEFFLERMSDDLYLHFEVIPDNLPDKLKEILKQFPANSLQFEIGVQTFDSDIQTLISRKQNNDKTRENIAWLREHTGAHLHTDLIFGLPSDSLDNFADSFNQLVALNPHEIQLGILKRLRGAPLNRHIEPYGLNYNPQAPYNILSTNSVDFMTMQRVNRFARFWDMIANSGRFLNTLPMILGDNPFDRFMQLSDRLYDLSGSTWKIALKRLFELLFVVTTEDFGIDANLIKAHLKLDYARAGVKGLPDYEALPSLNKTAKVGVANKRQRSHA
ncbi:MAG TPA: DUF4080 domain-containing protein [Methylophaga aminisulfidivorans]|uniref:DUF4080 domain-containing protein n=2 Tax=root TaxID=1 RepID=A0A7C1W4F8_9GAMM|nr:DUF4080 domain-containing protein [Methylophaga aminisulfidivorans]HEC74895.1 DUF4080 domain-containing protein [Methylophaga aminisulfidivorans]